MCHAELANPPRPDMYPSCTEGSPPKGACASRAHLVGTLASGETVPKRTVATIMASRGQPSSALAPGPYITVKSPRILARIPPAESPLTLTPTSRSPKSDPRTRRCRVGGSDCVLGSWLSFCELEEHWDSRKTFRSLGLRPGFDSLQTSSEVSSFIT